MELQLVWEGGRQKSIVRAVDYKLAARDALQRKTQFLCGLTRISCMARETYRGRYFFFFFFVNLMIFLTIFPKRNTRRSPQGYFSRNIFLSQTLIFTNVNMYVSQYWIAMSLASLLAMDDGKTWPSRFFFRRARIKSSPSRIRQAVDKFHYARQYDGTITPARLLASDLLN